MSVMIEPQNGSSQAASQVLKELEVFGVGQAIKYHMKHFKSHKES